MRMVIKMVAVGMESDESMLEDNNNNTVNNNKNNVGTMELSR